MLSFDNAFEVLPLDKFGAEVLETDLRAPIAEEAARQLRALLAKFQILIFREQAILPDEQIRVTRYFGRLEQGIAKRPQEHKVAGNPNVLYLSNRPGSPTKEYGVAWHSDGLAYAKVPHGITILHCIACPPHGGDTLFADQYRAYEAMSEDFRSLIDGMYWYLPTIPYSEVPEGKGLAQPIVRSHPETGRKFIFCSPGASKIRGKTTDESSAILDIVHEYQVRPEFVYRHKWRPGDVVIWENCTLLHNRADVVDYETQALRAMHRSATGGDYGAIETEPAGK